jgi:predicted ribosome quality control (RQC) complex YloA/Tae2 family protein
MKLQKLTSLDINILATELDGLLTGSVIKNIVSNAGGIYFLFSDFILHYFVFASTPYFLKAKHLPEGGRWLTNIINGKVKRVAQKEYDRLIFCEIVVFDRLGKRKNFNLYFEFFRNGNIVLTNKDDTIIKTLRRSKDKITKYKIVKPKGFNVLACEKNHVLSPREIDEIKALKLLQYALIDDYSPGELLKFVFDIKNNPSPHLLKDADNRICGYSIYGAPFTGNISGQKEDGLIEAVTSYLESKVSEKSIKSPGFKRFLRKAETKLKTIQAKLEQTREFSKWRLYGELLLANIHNIKKGKKLVILPNPYSEHDELVEIPLDPAVTTEGNARSYFNKARKLEASIPILKERLEEQKKEIERIKRLADSYIARDLIGQDGVRAKAIKKTKLPFRHYQLDGGWKVYIGKSALANDELTFSFAKKDDIWFHAWQASGSHIVLRRPQRGAIPDKKTLHKAASLAAYFSRAKTSGKVPVIYTEIRYVRKVKKYPGKVTVINEKQLIVEPLHPATLVKIKKSES